MVQERSIEHAPVLQIEAKQSPYSQNARVRVLLAGEHLHPDSELPQGKIPLPEKPHTVYHHIQTHWQQEREKVTDSKEEWGQKAARATRKLLATYQDDVEKTALLTTALDGLGVKVKTGTSQEITQALANDFTHVFYERFCTGDGMGIEELASALVDTFIPDVQLLPFVGAIDVRVTMELMQNFFGKFLGSEELYQQFALCVDAHVSRKVGEVHGVEVSDFPTEQEREILLTLHQAIGGTQPKSTHEVTEIPELEELSDARRDAPSAAQTIPLPSLDEEHEPTSPIQPVEEEEETFDDDDFGPPPQALLEKETSQKEDAPSMSEEQEANTMHEEMRLGVYDYRQARIDVLVLLLKMRLGEKIEGSGVQEIAQVLGIAPENFWQAMQQLIGFGEVPLQYADMVQINALLKTTPRFHHEKIPEFLELVEAQWADDITKQTCDQLKKINIRPPRIPLDIRHLLSREACDDLVEKVVRRHNLYKTTPITEEMQLNIVHAMVNMPTIVDQLEVLSRYTHLWDLVTRVDARVRRSSHVAAKQPAAQEATPGWIN